MQPTYISRQPEFPAVIALLASANLPIEDLTEEHCEHFFYIGPGISPNGLVGLELFGDVALLRSLVVAESRRGHGDGSRLLAHAESHARDRGVQRVYLLTTTAEKFFASRGYQPVARESAPPAIRASKEFSGICPASAVFMAREL